jgi:hypothetical protein
MFAVPLVGDTDSQFAPSTVLVLAVKAVAEDADTSTVWFSAVPPAVPLKLSDVTFGTTAVAPVTNTRTGTTTGTPPAAVGVSMISARYVPVGRVCGNTLTVRAAGVVRLEPPEICNHEGIPGAKLNVCAPPLLTPTLRVTGEGGALPEK